MIGNTLSSSLFILSSLHLKVCFLLCLRIIFFHTLPISSWKWCFQAHIPNVSSRKLIVNAFFHRKWQSSKVLTAEIFQSLLLWKLYPLKTTYFGVLIPFQSPSHQPHQPMHYGFSYHFSRNRTICFQNNIATSIFIENCWNLFYMIDHSQKFMPNIFLIKYDQYLQRYLQKTWRGRQVTLKFCVSTK